MKSRDVTFQNWLKMKSLVNKLLEPQNDFGKSKILFQPGIHGPKPVGTQPGKDKFRKSRQLGPNRNGIDQNFQI